MPVMRKCSFCGERVEPGKGVALVKRDGSLLFFCASKCNRNFDMGRKPQKLKWAGRKKRAGGKA